MANIINYGTSNEDASGNPTTKADAYPGAAASSGGGFSSWGQVASSGASGIGAIFSGIQTLEGADKSAAAYAKAAEIAGEDINITKASTAVKSYQAQRTIAQSLGKQRAQVAAAGFSFGGSAFDLLRSSVEEGALTKSLVASQGAITENNFLQQQNAALAQEAAAKASKTGAWGQIIGGVVQTAAMVAMAAA